MLTIEDWYCCLNPRERGILRSTALALPLTVYFGVPKDIWDSFWLAYSPNGLALRQSFVTSYALQIVTIEGEDGAFEAVTPAAGYTALWVEWSLFVVTPGAACLDGCQQSSFP